jgi:hypothetical protein
MEKGDGHLTGFAKHKPDQAWPLSLYGRKEARPSRVYSLGFLQPLPKCMRKLIAWAP